MKILKKISFYFVIFVSLLVVLASLLSLFHGIAFWFAGILDFPRLQYLILSVICLILIVLLRNNSRLPFYLLCSGLIAAIVVQSIKIYPYVIGGKSVPDISAKIAEKENTVGILIANILMTNRNSEKFIEIVKKTDPDMLLVMEVNDRWISELEGLKENYPYSIEYPVNNAYGMALYSKFALQNEEIMFLNDENVPSFHSEVTLPSGENFIFHGIHPMAPIPSSKYPDEAGRKEVALAKMGRIVGNDSLASMVVGDFNDVSWSHTSRMFGQQGKLKNVSLGRGLFNSFDANSAIMRWPLDHFFVTKQFSLLELKRLSKFDSDHFPMYAEFVLQN